MEDEKCCVCLENHPVKNLVSCSHNNQLCNDCYESIINTSNKCPLCRKKIKTDTYHDMDNKSASPRAEQIRRTIKTVSSRLIGKTGRIRCNDSRREDYTTRTVITSDPIRPNTFNMTYTEINNIE